MRSWIKTFSIVAVGALATTAAAAQEPVALKLATTAPPTSPVFLSAFKPWGDLIAKEGEADFRRGEARCGASPGKREAGSGHFVEARSLDRCRRRRGDRAWGWAALCALRIAWRAAAER